MCAIRKYFSPTVNDVGIRYSDIMVYQFHSTLCRIKWKTNNTTLSFIIKGSSGLDFLSFEVGYIMKQTKNTTLSFIIKGSSGLDFLSFEVGYIMEQTKNTTLSFIIKGSSGLDFLSFEVGYIMKETTYKMETYNKLLYFKWNFVVIRRLNFVWIKAPAYIWSDRWVGISVEIPFRQLC